MNIQAAGIAAERSLPSGLSDPDLVRYIKPGQGAQWWQMAFDDGIVPFDCYGIDHGLCQRGDWEKVEEELAKSGVKNIKDALRKLRDFYELPETAVWFTIADGRLPIRPCTSPPWPSQVSQSAGVKRVARGAAKA